MHQIWWGHAEKAYNRINSCWTLDVWHNQKFFLRRIDVFARHIRLAPVLTVEEAGSGQRPGLSEHLRWWRDYGWLYAGNEKTGLPGGAALCAGHGPAEYS